MESVVAAAGARTTGGFAPEQGVNLLGSQSVQQRARRRINPFPRDSAQRWIKGLPIIR